MGGANLSGWSKFGVGGADVGRTVWRVADNLEKTLLCKFLFSWPKFLKIDTYICDRICENPPLSPVYVIRAIAHFRRLSKFLSIFFLVQKLKI